MTNTPSGSFLPMWFAIFARVRVGAKPTPHGTPTQRRTVSRMALPKAWKSATSGRLTCRNASSMEYGSTSGENSFSVARDVAVQLVVA